MEISQETYYLLALTRIDGIGAITARKLLKVVQNPKRLFDNSEKELQKEFGIGKITAKNIHQYKNFDEVDKELLFVEKEQVEIITILDDKYPPLLKHCPDAPVVLFAKGNTEILPNQMLSIVGTRNVTSYGVDFTQKLIGDIKEYQSVIVSGYAFGVDILAHLSAIENNLKTIAVLGHSLQHTYPAMHRKYNKKIEENGLFLTEFWSSDTIQKENFIQRNRIVAGISQATIVVESAKKGGSLVTAKMANDYNREVFALPGRTTDRYSEGCNYLIKTNQAHLITSASDLIYHLNWKHEEPQPKTIQPELFIDLNETEQKVYDLLSERKKELLDLISLDTQIPLHQLGMILLTLELKGIIRPLPGKYYELIT